MQGDDIVERSRALGAGGRPRHPPGQEEEEEKEEASADIFTYTHVGKMVYYSR